MSAGIPDSVKTRNRTIHLTDAAIAVVILSAALQFFEPGIANMAWALGALAANLGTVVLRKQINYNDLPTAELDEYEIQRLFEAREDGFRAGLFLSIALLIISVIVALASQYWVELDATDVALFFAKLLTVQVLWVPFIIARSLAGKITRDELIAR
ncbi:hypothetical protein QYQ98_03105 [Corynebacterium sp. P3-F1]|uniref:hypothetical protein n=1 Tax=Corynebacterium sp. P3-F1 TaxID=3059080 RepID=UPI00265CCAF3|nr:hypothetical protein [Corynebacterium sp. P3-F1]WKK61894.1 hypothetical protein QYQ98_03105 [Corynebacterium sp. P3-F1]